VLAHVVQRRETEIWLAELGSHRACSGLDMAVSFAFVRRQDGECALAMYMQSNPTSCAMRALNPS
jgi:hypothetical protein